MKTRIIIFCTSLLIFVSIGSFANHNSHPRSTFSVRKAISARAAQRAMNPKIDSDAILNNQKSVDTDKAQGAISRSISVIQRVVSFIQSSENK